MKPKIAILSAFITPYRSGAEACAEEVPLALEDQYDFTIVTCRMHPNLPARALLQGRIPVIRVGIGSKIDKWLYPFLAPMAVRSLQPDLVHGVLESFAGLALKFCWGYKRLLTLQTTNTSFLKGFILKSPDRVTAISRILQRIAATHNRTDVQLIPNGIHASAIKKACEAHPKVAGRVLFAGRLELMKGVDVLLPAFANIAIGLSDEEDPTVGEHVHLHVVGDGSQRKLLEKMLVDLDLGGRVTFLGKLEPEDLYREYAEAEVFCGLSRSEALGNVFMEAQAAGCAVLSTNVDGIPDIVEHEKTGMLIEPDDENAAAAALEKLINDADLRLRLTTVAKDFAHYYDWSFVAGKYAEVYKAMIAT